MCGRGLRRPCEGVRGVRSGGRGGWWDGSFKLGVCLRAAPPPAGIRNEEDVARGRGRSRQCRWGLSGWSARARPAVSPCARPFTQTLCTSVCLPLPPPAWRGAPPGRHGLPFPNHPGSSAIPRPPDGGLFPRTGGMLAYPHGQCPHQRPRHCRARRCSSRPTAASGSRRPPPRSSRRERAPRAGSPRPLPRRAGVPRPRRRRRQRRQQRPPASATPLYSLKQGTRSGGGGHPSSAHRQRQEGPSSIVARRHANGASRESTPNGETGGSSQFVHPTESNTHRGSHSSKARKKNNQSNSPKKPSRRKDGVGGESAPQRRTPTHHHRPPHSKSASVIFGAR